MRKRTEVSGVGLLLVVVVLLASVIGWCANIVKMVGITDGITGWLVLRTIGVFVPPLGAVLGWL